MRRRLRFGALGLRGRIVGALLITTTATLAVAALALLGPLERSLRNAELATLVTNVTGEIGAFRTLGPVAIDQALRGARPPGRVRHAVRAVRVRTGGEVSLFAYPRTLVATSEPGGIGDESFADVTAAFLSGRRRQGFSSDNGADIARVAVPFGGGPGVPTYVLEVRKSLVAVASAARAVRVAFLTAAAAGLLLTLLLGLVIAATLVRRLRRLRQAALVLAEGGPPVELRVTRARDEVGDLTRTFAIMQRRLQHQEQARRAFVSTASHELRTPLTSLDGMLELLDDDLRTGEPDITDALVLLGRARAQSRRLARLANDLLDLSKLDAEVTLRSEPVELGELGRAVLAEFDLGAAERGVHPVLVDSERPAWALADPGSVAQILRILLDNAIRISPPGREIAVSLDTGADGMVALIVRDEGPGVPEKERELIFERFKRGSSTGGRGGFGLGLAIGRELAERMGGTLELVDDGGPGASFCLRLRAAQAPEPLETASGGHL